MNITSSPSKVRSIRQDDPNFLISDKFTLTPRASFEVSTNCPSQYKQVIAECINNQWLKPVAYISEKEAVFIGLNK
jgi:hypothetical protein